MSEVLSLDRVILSLVVRLVQKMCVKKSEKKKLKKSCGVEPAIAVVLT